MFLFEFISALCLLFFIIVIYALRNKKSKNWLFSMDGGHDMDNEKFIESVSCFVSMIFVLTFSIVVIVTNPWLIFYGLAYFVYRYSIKVKAFFRKQLKSLLEDEDENTLRD